MPKTLIGVMGPGAHPTEEDLETAYQIGALIAQKGWVLLTGGRRAGVMQAASRGAKEAGGITVGILPGDTQNNMSDYVDLPIVTGMGSARNNINVLSSKVIIACGIGAGTMSEIMLALKAGKHVILLNQRQDTLSFLNRFNDNLIYAADTPDDAIARVAELL